MSSCGRGNVPGATGKLARPVTVSLPVPLDPPLASKVRHVPPPVTSCGLPGFERNMPEPVSVIFELSLARAEAIRPAEAVPVAKLMLKLSHGMVRLVAGALEFVVSQAGSEDCWAEAGG